MSEPTREDVQHFLKALQYGMKVTHKPEFLMALAEGWLKAQSKTELKLYSMDLQTGDVVKSNGNWADKTVAKTATQGEGVTVFWTDGRSTRYHLYFEHSVLRN